MFKIFVSCPHALEYLLADEVTNLGLNVNKISPQGVYIDGNINDIYRLCLWSRIASRVQVILFEGAAEDTDAIYKLCYNFDWLENFTEHNTFAIKFHGTSRQIRNSMFGALLIKDAIVDYFLKATNQRPNVAKEDPDILLHAHLQNSRLTVSLDMTGYSLHQRGYRAKNYEAPLKENIAAAMLYRAKWPDLISENYQLYDPFCGTGTIVIEAAMMLLNIAPGLLKEKKSFNNWQKHDPSIWGQIKSEAKSLIKSPVDSVLIHGSDISPKAIQIAKESAIAAGVDDIIVWKQLDFSDYRQENTKKGLFITNPPFGERLSSPEMLKPLYKKIGENLHKYFPNWNASILTYDPMLAKAIQLRANKQYKLYNGALECKLYCFNLDENNKLIEFSSAYKKSPQAEMFANRLKKNYQHLKKWAKRNNIECYRVYDADLPEYSFAIDIYNSHSVIQEYKAPESVPEEKAKQRLMDVLNITPEILEIPKDNVIFKTREKQKGKQQYTKLSNSKTLLKVNEGRAIFKINLTDYLDTGIFLDHRIMRLKFANLSPKTKFLNCYCYTGTASVHAALSGAITTNIDLSNTYLSWAKENFLLNSIDIKQHRFIQEDCVNWLKDSKENFDVIFLDPPSFSNSKSMQDTLDIQRDHPELIAYTVNLLKPNGILYFSTNFRKFKLQPELLTKYNIQDISASTIDLDFKRDSKIHYCFKITRITHRL